MLDLRAHVRPGDGVWWSQAGAEATPLVDTLLDQLSDLGPLRAFCGLTLNPRLRDVPEGLALTSYGAMGELRRANGIDIVPAHYSQLPRLFAERLLPSEVGLVQVSPPDADGRCSLGVGVDFAADAIPHSRTVIAEINHRKEIDTGLVVTGQAIGGSGLYTRLDGMPVQFRPASYTHDAGVLSRLTRLVAINSALQVDLDGQVGSEVVGGRYLGGIGGQADFSGAAARTGALSIIAVRSTAGGRTTVVPRLDGPVTTARADVDIVVTEHGTAWMRGCPTSERGTRLAAVAAPEHRDDLLRALREGTPS